MRSKNSFKLIEKRKMSLSDIDIHNKTEEQILAKKTYLTTYQGGALAPPPNMKKSKVLRGNTPKIKRERSFDLKQRGAFWLTYIFSSIE